MGQWKGNKTYNWLWNFGGLVEERKEELQTILDIYKILKQDDSQYNLYNDSKLLDKLIEKAETELKELKWVRKQTKKKNSKKWLLKF